MYIPIWILCIAAGLILVGIYFLWFTTKLAAQIRCLEYCWRDLANFVGISLSNIVRSKYSDVIRSEIPSTAPNDQMEDLIKIINDLAEKTKKHREMIVRVGAPIYDDNSYVFEDFVLQAKSSANDEPFFLSKGRKNQSN